MRVLQAMAGGPHGGAEAFFERLAAAFARRRIAQRVLIRRDPERAARLRREGVEVDEAPFGGRLDFITRRRFGRVIADFSPDVVLTWMSRATRFCPRVTAAHPFVHVARLGGYYDLKYYRACEHLIGNTHGIVEYLRTQGWPAERAHYLPNFVSAERTAPVAREAWNTPAGAALVLSLGRLHTNKAFDVLIDAVSRMPGAYAWIAGEGPERAALERRAAEQGVAERVRFLGWRDDAPALLAACDVFACPSRHEPLGNVVLEAWAQGIPVVAAASQGPRELIVPEKTGLLVAIDDAPALAAALQRVVSERELAARLAAAGRAAFEADFTEEVVVGRYLDFLDRVTRPCAA